jgi:hypothetical protein
VHPSIPVEDNRPKIMFADAPVANGQLEAKFDRRHKHQISAIPLICVERTVDGTYDWLTAVEHFWLSWSTLPPRPVGRPAMNTERDEQICKLGKTHSNKELARDFHLAASGIAKIKRDHKASSAAKIA